MCKIWFGFGFFVSIAYGLFSATAILVEEL